MDVVIAGDVGRRRRTPVSPAPPRHARARARRDGAAQRAGAPGVRGRPIGGALRRRQVPRRSPGRRRGRPRCVAGSRVGVSRETSRVRARALARPRGVGEAHGRCPVRAVGSARGARGRSAQGCAIHPFPAIARANRLRGLYATVVGPRRDAQLGERVPSKLDRARVVDCVRPSTRVSGLAVKRWQMSSVSRPSTATGDRSTTRSTASARFGTRSPTVRASGKPALVRSCRRREGQSAWDDPLPWSRSLAPHAAWRRRALMGDVSRETSPANPELANRLARRLLQSSDRDSRCRRRPHVGVRSGIVCAVGPRSLPPWTARYAGCCGPLPGRARCGGGCEPHSHRYHRDDVSRETSLRPPPAGTASREGSSISDHDTRCGRMSRADAHSGSWGRWVVGCRCPAHRARRELRGGRARCTAAGLGASLALPSPSAMFHVKHGPVNGHRWARLRDGPCRAGRGDAARRPIPSPGRNAVRIGRHMRLCVALGGSARSPRAAATASGLAHATPRRPAARTEAAKQAVRSTRARPDPNAGVPPRGMRDAVGFDDDST